jgi:hypothetical protein
MANVVREVMEARKTTVVELSTGQIGRWRMKGCTAYAACGHLGEFSVERLDVGEEILCPIFCKDGNAETLRARVMATVSRDHPDRDLSDIETVLFKRDGILGFLALVPQEFVAG